MDVVKLAKLAKLKVDKKEGAYFQKQFDETLKIIEEFNKIDTSKTPQTYIVTGTQNVLREDKIDSTKVLTQEEALSNAKRTHNGFFMVDAILDEN